MIVILTDPNSTVIQSVSCQTTGQSNVKKHWQPLPNTPLQLLYGNSFFSLDTNRHIIESTITSRMNNVFHIISEKYLPALPSLSCETSGSEPSGLLVRNIPKKP